MPALKHRPVQLINYMKVLEDDQKETFIFVWSSWVSSQAPSFCFWFFFFDSTIRLHAAELCVKQVFIAQL